MKPLVTHPNLTLAALFIAAITAKAFELDVLNLVCIWLFAVILLDDMYNQWYIKWINRIEVVGDDNIIESSWNNNISVKGKNVIINWKRYGNN